MTPWVEVPGFSIKRVRWDSAHTILLGTGKDVAASFLFDMDLWFRHWHILGFLLFAKTVTVVVVFNKDQKKNINTFKPTA